MKKTLMAGLAQARLNTSEKEILGRTLTACVQVVTEVLSVVNPAAFSRAMRLRRYVVHVVKTLGMPNLWKFEVAAMMSQLGCVTIAPEIIQVVHTSQLLPDEDRAVYDHHPIIAQRLLENIPRMKQIAWMIAHQNKLAPVVMNFPERELVEMRAGAEILRVALQFDELMQKGECRGAAWTILNRRFKNLDTKILDALIDTDQESEHLQVRSRTVAEISPGMIVREDVFSAKGSLLAAKGQDVTAPLILKLKNFQDSGAFSGAFLVSAANSVSADTMLSVPSKEQSAAGT